MIHTSGSGLLRLINDILDLSKIEAGRMELRLSPCDIMSEIVRAAVEMKPLAASKGLDLRIQIEPGPTVVVDADRLRQILVNLVGNAIKFTERGRIEVRGSVAGEPPELVLEVQDSGIGIAQDLQASVFLEFRQADGSPSRRFGGTGLGLAISRRLAELMEGTLTVQSDPGEGSTFRLVVPVARARGTGPSPRTAQAA
jgi:signal transduction histidine kinase